MNVCGSNSPGTLSLGQLSSSRSCWSCRGGGGAALLSACSMFAYVTGVPLRPISGVSGAKMLRSNGSPYRPNLRDKLHDNLGIISAMNAMSSEDWSEINVIGERNEP